MIELLCALLRTMAATTAIGVWAFYSPGRRGNGKIMKRKASAVWRGGLKEGKGALSTESGVLSQAQYSFSTRFETGVGTNPEELIAAAHAGCFSMALSAELGKVGITPESIQTTATVTMERLEAGCTVTQVHLDVAAMIPGTDPPKFSAAANSAKAGCPISRLLNATITMDARLES
jgi:osmotically inducible protein OsmC